MTAAPDPAFRFRPRLRVYPWAVAFVGGVLLAAIPLFGLAGASRRFALGCGIAGLVLATLYVLSPAWRLRVVVAADALVVERVPWRPGRRGELRLRLAWSEVVRVVAAPASRTLFVDAGVPARSFLVPGPGAPAPYRIERRDALYDAILAHVPAERVVEVDSLLAHRRREGSTSAPR